MLLCPLITFLFYLLPLGYRNSNNCLNVTQYKNTELALYINGKYIPNKYPAVIRNHCCTKEVREFLLSSFVSPRLFVITSNGIYNQISSLSNRISKSKRLRYIYTIGWYPERNEKHFRSQKAYTKRHHKN